MSDSICDDIVNLVVELRQDLRLHNRYLLEQSQKLKKDSGFGFFGLPAAPGGSGASRRHFPSQKSDPKTSKWPRNGTGISEKPRNSVEMKPLGPGMPVDTRTAHFPQKPGKKTMKFGVLGAPGPGPHVDPCQSRFGNASY